MRGKIHGAFAIKLTKNQIENYSVRKDLQLGFIWYIVIVTVANLVDSSWATCTARSRLPCQTNHATIPTIRTVRKSEK